MYGKKSGLELVEEPACFEYAAPRLNPAATPDIYGSHDFMLAFARLCDAAGAQNVGQLAEFFRVRLSKISDVKRREQIPVVWLYHLLLTRRISPQWIVYGTGPRELELADIVDESVSALLLRQAMG